ncbi:MAG: transcription antitermination factor NusB [Syntrophomonadaceae bacterium]|nr:transcription antitermination factor NusB [Syntrophomonadaceae bacterium]HAA08836.1 transcription antitermination factor NusB [Syntrophomonas sp.]HQA49174.1 transcription antitermination factor NusB [Syntrophomonadaceae bacterium]HQD89787.1 transcription antitermination factor NusB [Syntrophomonadaceae bacterium]
MSRRKAREHAFKVIFQVDQVQAEPKQAFEYLCQEQPLPDKDRQFAWELVEGTLEYMPAIDERIARYSREWSVDRMSSVDRNIMRVAGYEILFRQEVSPVIAIDEAVELAKRFGEEQSGGFVNAILDRIQGEKHESVFRD